MRIALITYDFPPDTPGGGIATYLLHATRMLSDRGDEVEVFARSPFRDERQTCDGFHITWVKAHAADEFRQRVVGAFSERHRACAFDVIEGSDYNASALGIKRAFCDIPYVVKLHTPSFFIEELHNDVPKFITRLRMHVGALRRGMIYRPWNFTRSPNAMEEIASIKEADEIAAPSKAIADAVLKRVAIEAARISVFPYCYQPSQNFLNIQADRSPESIIFLGRLEVRKGVLDLAKAFIDVLQHFPDTRLVFVGRPMPMPRKKGRTTEDEIRNILGRRVDRVSFLGQRNLDEIPSLLAEAGIAVFPSHWESFGLVCCEAMAAARAVVGSASGGMAEILDGGKAGRLVAAESPSELADVLVRLLSCQSERARLGEAGRARIASWMSYDAIYDVQIASYRRAIKRAQEKR